MRIVRNGGGVEADGTNNGSKEAEWRGAIFSTRHPTSALVALIVNLHLSRITAVVNPTFRPLIRLDVAGMASTILL